MSRDVASLGGKRCSDNGDQNGNITALETSSHAYQHLKVLLRDLNVKPEDCGLVRIYRKKTGFSWVCKGHRKTNDKDCPTKSSEKN